MMGNVSLPDMLGSSIHPLPIAYIYFALPTDGIEWRATAVFSFNQLTPTAFVSCIVPPRPVPNRYEMHM